MMDIEVAKQLRQARQQFRDSLAHVEKAIKSSEDAQLPPEVLGRIDLAKVGVEKAIETVEWALHGE